MALYFHFIQLTPLLLCPSSTNPPDGDLPSCVYLLGESRWCRCPGVLESYVFHHQLEERSPTFLAPGTGFVEDSFSTDGAGGWMLQVVK